LILEDAENLLSPRMRLLVAELRNELDKLEDQIDAVSKELADLAKREDSSRRLLTVPGIGPLVATALTAAIGNGAGFAKARDLPAWLGLVPRQHSTGGKARLLGISKRGDPYLRKLFVHGARAVLTRIKRDEHSFGDWLNELEARSPKNVAIVAMANKLARIAWAVLTRGEVYCVTVCTQAVENRAPDPELGIGTKLHILLRIELARRIDQTQCASRNQFLELHMLGQSLGNLRAT